MDPAEITQNLQNIGQYKLASLLGFNGIVATYKGFDQNLDIPAAVHIIHKSLVVKDGAWEKFNAEIAPMRNAGASRICQPMHYGEDNDHYWVSYEWQSGNHVGIRVRDHGLPDKADAFQWISEFCGALATLHSRGCAHRIISPASILLNNMSQAKLLHAAWGRVLLGVSEGVRNPAYLSILPFASPEIASGEEGDESSDVFSLGANLFYLLTGQPIFWDEDPNVLAGMIMGHDVSLELLKGEISDEALEVLGEMLSRDPDDRPVNLPALSDRLGKISMLMVEEVEKAKARQEVIIHEEEEVQADDEPSSRISEVLRVRQAEVQERNREQQRTSSSSTSKNKTVTVLDEKAETKKQKNTRVILMVVAGVIILGGVGIAGVLAMMGVFGGKEEETPPPVKDPVTTAAPPKVDADKVKFQQAKEKLRMLGQFNKGYMKTNGRWALNLDELKSIGAKNEDLLDPWNHPYELRGSFVLTGGTDGKWDTPDDFWYDSEAAQFGGFAP